MAAASPPIELHFLQAPRALPIPEDARKRALESGRSLEKIQRYSWWNASDDGKEYRGWRDSVAYIQEFMESEGPFHGILGFSQGAAMAAVVAASAPKTAKCELSFGIMIGGFPPRDPDLQALIKESPALRQIQSLHVIGEADEVVKPGYSRMLAQAFHSPSFLLHPGGHYIPTSQSHCERFIEFILQNGKLL